MGRWQEGCSHGAMHCDLLLSKLYVRCSIYHVLYLSTSVSLPTLHCLLCVRVWLQ